MTEKYGWMVVVRQGRQRFLRRTDFVDVTWQEAYDVASDIVSINHLLPKDLQFEAWYVNNDATEVYVGTTRKGRYMQIKPVS